MSLFDSIAALRRWNLRRKNNGGHAMLLISLGRLFRRVDVGSLGLMLESLSCYELAILSCSNGYRVWLLRKTLTRVVEGIVLI